jgi:hypothetical protein
MELFLRFGTYFVFLIYPVLAGLLLRGKKVTIRQVVLTTNLLISIYFGFLYAFSVVSGAAPPSITSLSFVDWAISITISALLWLSLFVITKPFHKK